MNKWLTRQNVLICVSVLLVLLLVYLVPFAQQFWETWQRMERSNRLVEKVETAPDLLIQQHRQLRQLAQQVDQLQSQSVQLQTHVDFVQYLEALCREHRVKVVALPREQGQEVEGFHLIEESFSLEGDIFGLLTVLHTLEQIDRVGSLATFSLTRTSLSLFQQKQNILVATVSLHRLHTQS